MQTYTPTDPFQDDSPARELRDNHLFVRSNGALVKLAIADISHVTADGNYCFVVLNDDERYAVKNSLKAFKERLSDRGFLQSSRGQIVNFSHIAEVNFVRSYIRLGRYSQPLPIGAAYRKEVEAWINRV